jgi:putative ABC transport system permease protein
MSFPELITLAIRAIVSNKLRSILTTLGIVIGVFAIIVLVSIGSGLQSYINDQITSLGSNILDVMPGGSGFGGGPFVSINKLTIQLGKKVQARLITTADTSPMVEAVANFKYKSVIDKGAYIIGTTSNYPKTIIKTKMVQGTFFTIGQEQSSTKVAVIGYSVYTKYFNGQRAVGQRMFIGNNQYTIVGVTDKIGSFLGIDRDNLAYIPIGAVKEQFGVDRLTEIAVNAKSPELIPIIKKQITDTLVKSNLTTDDFNIQTGQSLADTVANITNMLSLALGGIAAISLLVGGIGVANIMLVSVTERTKEIGLRKALGAKRNDILKQFLLEAVMLSVTGGIIGIILGMLVSVVIAILLVSTVTWWSVALAFSFSVAIGVIFGMAPAIRASKLSPIDALRYE